MLKRHKKQGAAGWERKLTLFVGFLFSATLLLFLAWAVYLYLDW